MADDKKNQEEYEYPPEEYYKGGEYIPPDESADTLEHGAETRASFLSKRFLLFVGFLIAIAIVYLVVSFINAKKRAELAQPTPGVAAVPSTAPTPIAVQQQPAAVQQVVPTPSPAEEAAMQRMAQQNQANQQTLADLQNQIGQLQSQLGQVTNSISTLNNQIQVLANEIRAIAVERSIRGKGMGLTMTGTSYHLKALVPGRAWLQSRDGNTTSVTIGDRLPGYGIVQMINTDQGVVTTSSGALIQYGPKDN